MVVSTLPTMHDGACIELGAGTLAITLQAVGNDPIRPVNFTFYGYRRLDRDASVDVSVNQVISTFSLRLSGGRYCYVLENRSPVSPDANMAELTNYWQNVLLQMILAP